MNTMLKIAKEIAMVAHRGQVDKAGNPYIQHPKAVADMLMSAEEKTVAWLHDVLEDTDYTREHLAVFFPESIVDAVETLTKTRGEHYDEYLKRVAENPLAVRVKLATLEHNADLKRYESPSEKDINRVHKYLARRETLLNLAKNREV